MYYNINIQNIKFNIPPIIDPFGRIIDMKDAQDLMIMKLVKDTEVFRSRKDRMK